MMYCFLLSLLSIILLISVAHSSDFRTFSIKFSGPSIGEILTPTQVKGFEVIIKIIKTKYTDDYPVQVETGCKVLDQRLSRDRRRLQRSLNLRSLENDMQNYYLDIDFSMSWSSNSNIIVDQSIYANEFFTFMNSEEGYKTISEYMRELGLRIEHVYPLRIIETNLINIASALPPITDPTHQPSLIIERFSITLIGDDLGKLSINQLTAFEVFLELFTSSYGFNGGEPNVSTACEVASQELSLTLLRQRRRNMIEIVKSIVTQQHRDLTTTFASNFKYYLDIKFSMMWTTSLRDIDLNVDNYLKDFMTFVNSDIGMRSLREKLIAVGVLVDDISALRIVHNPI